MVKHCFVWVNILSLNSRQLFLKHVALSLRRLFSKYIYEGFQILFLWLYSTLFLKEEPNINTTITSVFPFVFTLLILYNYIFCAKALPCYMSRGVGNSSLIKLYCQILETQMWFPAGFKWEVATASFLGLTHP